MSCLFPNCRNTKRLCKDNRIRFFKFPTLPYVRDKWLQACKITEENLPKHPFVCSVHFASADISSQKRYTRLSFSAIPRFEKYQEPLSDDDVNGTSKNIVGKSEMKSEAKTEVNQKMHFASADISSQKRYTRLSFSAIPRFERYQESLRDDDVNGTSKNIVVKSEVKTEPKTEVTESKGCCRVCLEDRADNILLINNCNGANTYLEIFNECTRLWAHPNEELCTVCSQELVLFHKFLCKARESDVKLKELYSTHKNEQSQQPYFNEDFGEAYITSWEGTRSPQVESVVHSEDPLDDNYNENELTTEGFNKEEGIISDDNDDTKAHKCGITTLSLEHSQNGSHLLTRLYPRIYFCSICPKTFRAKYKLKIHQRLHTGVRPFECEFCKKRFASKSTLHSHMRRHTGELPYSCAICGKHFIQTSSRNNHMKMVHWEKTIQCPHCEKKYARKIDLVIHLRSVSGEKPFECEFCLKRFNRRGYLNEHLQKRHHSSQAIAKGCIDVAKS